jgi:hypothetical protein
MFLIVHTPDLDFILDAVSRWACGVNLLQYTRGDLQSIGRRRSVVFSTNKTDWRTRQKYEITMYCVDIMN